MDRSHQTRIRSAVSPQTRERNKNSRCFPSAGPCMYVCLLGIEYQEKEKGTKRNPLNHAILSFFHFCHACPPTPYSSSSFSFTFVYRSMPSLLRIWSIAPVLRMVSNVAMERACHATDDVVRFNRTSNPVGNVGQRLSVSLQLSSLDLLLSGVHV